MSLKRIIPPKFPIFWITTLAFFLVAAFIESVVLLAFVIVVIFPAILFGQSCARWLLRFFGFSVWLRRTAMLLPALIVSALIYRDTNCFGGMNTTRITRALAGHTPSGIRDLVVQIDDWTDYVLLAHFQCEPDSLQQILEHSPFVLRSTEPEKFSFSSLPFPSVRARPDITDCRVYRRTDLRPMQDSCHVYTDSKFSFAYVEFGID